jgi:Mg2+-importing ATPase
MEMAHAEAAEALQQLGTSLDGLSEEEAALRLERYGPNVVASDERFGRLRLFLRACLNPLVLLLAVLASVSAATGDIRAAAVMAVMILLGVGLRFSQEARANAAAEKLRAMIRVTATVVRGSQFREEPLAAVVPGDVVQLSAGDMIPADIRILSCRDLFITQASLTHRLICKGAPEEVFKRCSQFELDKEVQPIEAVLIEELREEHESLCRDGFRVLALAYRDFEPRHSYSKDDESNMILAGYVAFLDPPKESAGEAVATLGARGVAVKILTGDNDLVARKICQQVGIPTEEVLLGSQVEKMSDAELGEAAERITLFARVTPGHKQRVIQVLQDRKHVVGFLGDGINDSPALRASDVGISVDTAVDIAKEAADVILLEKSLMVLGQGVEEGRKVFCNILKYVRMGASSNFGNMFSVLGGSVFLPFVPMAPIQILTNNLLYDFSQVPIPTDDVDPEQIAAPRPWSMPEITRFILFIGPCSSVFDYTTYLMMLYVFHCWDPGRASLFQTGWFVESLLTQTLIIHVIRTNRIPWLQSRASPALMTTTVAIMLVGLWLPVSPLGPALRFTPLPHLYWPFLAATLLAYMLLTQGVKVWLLRRHWL